MRPLRRHAGEPGQHDAREGRETGGLDAHGHERRHDRRRALVDVRRPDVEGHQRDLEAEAHQQERQAETELQREAVRRDRTRDDVEPRAAGGAVDERDAVEQERARERAQQKVLDRGLARTRVAAQRPRQHVDRHRHDLEGEEDHDQVVGRRHERHARGREQDQCIVFARRYLVLAQIVDGHEERARRSRTHQDGEEERVAVGAERVLEAAGHLSVPEPEHRYDGDRQAAQSENRERLLVDVAEGRVDDQHEKRRRGDEQPGQRHLPVRREGAHVDRCHRHVPLLTRARSTR